MRSLPRLPRCRRAATLETVLTIRALTKSYAGPRTRTVLAGVDPYYWELGPQYRYSGPSYQLYMAETAKKPIPVAMRSYQRFHRAAAPPSGSTSRTRSVPPGASRAYAERITASCAAGAK